MGAKNKNAAYGCNLLRIDKMVTVTDDWYPCFEGNKIRVSMFITNTETHKFVRICAWGADDTGVELDFTGNNYETLVNHYNFWKENVFEKITDGIDRQWFFDHCFYPA